MSAINVLQKISDTVWEIPIIYKPGMLLPVWFAGAIIAGLTSFIATNIDDIVILTIFFAQVGVSLRIRHIVAGQYLGFFAIILASLPGFFGGLIIPKAWTGLLGLIPITLGIMRLIQRDSDNEVQAVSQEVNPSSNNSLWSKLKSFFHPQTYNVAAVTFANGGDNISIYVSLFASSNIFQLAIILAVFLLMVAVLCAIAYLLTRHPAVTKIVADYGHAIVPFVLIGLGIFILVESGSFRLLTLF